MKTSHPERYNDWGEWKPIIATCSQEEYFRLGAEAQTLISPEGRAIANYCSFTGYCGVEFVLFGAFLDTKLEWELPNGIKIAPCDNVRRRIEAGDQAPETIFDGSINFLYDGWMPLEKNESSAIYTAIETIEETITSLAYCVSTPMDWVVKYVETVMPTGREFSHRNLTDEDEELCASFLTATRNLPPRVRSALTRTLSWYQRGSTSRSLSDRFLAYYYALEGLGLALWSNARAIGLPPSVGKVAERMLQDDESKGKEIRVLLEQSSDIELPKAVSDSYFAVIVGIRRRLESVLRAAFGEDSKDAEWPFRKSESTGLSPSDIRSSLAHGSVSESQLLRKSDLAAVSEKLRIILRELIVRTVRQSWGGEPIPFRTIQLIHTISADNTIACAPGGGWRATGDFRITPALLARKGLL